MKQGGELDVDFIEDGELDGQLHICWSMITTITCLLDSWRFVQRIMYLIEIMFEGMRLPIGSKHIYQSASSSTSMRRRVYHAIIL